jgi:hypothetical protein
MQKNKAKIIKELAVREICQLFLSQKNDMITIFHSHRLLNPIEVKIL